MRPMARPFLHRGRQPPMSRTDDLRAALACRPARAVPRWELEFHAFDAVSGRHLVLGREFEALSATERDRALHDNAEIILSVCDELEFAAVTAPNSYWEQGPGELAYYVLPDDYSERQMGVLREMAGDALLLVANVGGVLGASYDVEFCQKLKDAPGEIDALARRTLAEGLERARRFRDRGADVAMTASDVADNSGPFFKPHQMERFVFPHLEKWSDGVHAMGMASLLHSDGNLTAHLDRIAGTSLDALQAIDPVAGMDLVRSKEVVGDRLCLCGNVDCGLLVAGTPGDVYAATRDLLVTWGSRTGLVLGASNAVQREVPFENYRAMVAAWRASRDAPGPDLSGGQPVP
jgi:uroporphyrinogen decarboxylase